MNGPLDQPLARRPHDGDLWSSPNHPLRLLSTSSHRHHHHEPYPLAHRLIPRPDFAASSTVTPSPPTPSDTPSSHTMQASSSSSTIPPEDYAALQKLSDEYRPEAVGPLVGKRQSSEAIADEYANAEDVYVSKTTALPAKYSYYRTVRGDGNCGWRALAFGYFETLLHLRDRGRIQLEQTRFRSLNNLLNRAGFEEHLYEAFVEETIGLLDELAGLVPATLAASSTLLERFNDPDVSSAIITHFRLLTSAWMKTHAEAYQPFILDGTVAQYCASQIDPYQVEIEHIGMNALIDALVKPAGFAVEISYLDRSPGVEVNTHRFEATAADGTALYHDAPTMYLLYRPGHYDLLYRFQDPPETQVNLVSAVTSFNAIQGIPMASALGDFGGSFMADIPGLSFASISNGGGGRMVSGGLSSEVVPPGMSNNSALSNEYARSPISPVVPTAPIASGVPVISSSAEQGVGGFRPSRYELELLRSSGPNAPPFQTPSFRNSHYNPAHFLNTNFQPEMWRPELEGGSSSSPKDELHHRRHL